MFNKRRDIVPPKFLMFDTLEEVCKIRYSKIKLVMMNFLTKLLNKRRAFTLVEILITVGVIGVVAAMTIPNLENKNMDYLRCPEKLGLDKARSCNDK